MLPTFKKEIANACTPHVLFFVIVFEKSKTTPKNRTLPWFPPQRKERNLLR
jgi:hypothetical protein